MRKKKEREIKDVLARLKVIKISTENFTAKSRRYYS